MEVILNYINKYKEVFIKENTNKIRLLDNYIKKLKIPSSFFPGMRILLNEKPYEYSISRKTGKITRQSIGVFTKFHIGGILLFYSMLGSIGFITSNFTPTCTLQRILTLLCGDVKKGQELLIFLKDNTKEIPPIFFAEYLYYIHNVLLINRYNIDGVVYDQIKSRYKKKYTCNDNLISKFINELINEQVEVKIMVMNLGSTFYQDIETSLNSLTKIYVANVMSPLTVNVDYPSYYDTWYLLDDDKIKIKNNLVEFSDFLIGV